MVMPVLKSNEANVICIQSIHEVQDKVLALLKDYAAEEVLVAVDVDMTLTQPTHPATYYPNIMKHKEALKSIFKDLSNVQKDAVLTLAVTKTPQKLVESDSPKIIKNLQSLGVRVIAFTASLTGSWKDSKSKIIFKRKDALRSLGFNFSFLGRVVSYMDFPKYADGFPILYHGVLCSNGEQNGIGKGKVLTAFLKQISVNKDGSTYCKPKVIVMVDDKKKNLEDAKIALKTEYPDMKFIPLEYQGSLNYATEEIGENDFREYWEGLVGQVCVR